MSARMMRVSAGPPSHDVGGWSAGLDRASIAVALRTGPVGPAVLTVGVQRIEIGSQFLIGDGVYDGFSRDARQGIYHGPRRSFDAVRLRAPVAGAHVDAFRYMVHPTWDAGGGRDGGVAGLDITGQVSSGGPALALGAWQRWSPSKLDNDMTVLNLRIGQNLLLPGLLVSGEVAAEAGTCRNACYCATFTGVNDGASASGTRNSVDVILATGVTFR